MIRLTITFLFSLSLMANYYSDHAGVQELANSGDYSLELNSQGCPKRFGASSHIDLLGKDLCVEALKLPSIVESEVVLMKEHELANESDYDQRVTELLLFKWNLIAGAQISLKQLKNLGSSLSIPHKDMASARFSSLLVSSSSFSEFGDLFVGLDFRENSKTSQFISRTFLDKNVQVIQFTDELGLYPGGGFTVTHTLIISKDRAMYIKLSSWDS